jgi:DNA-binding CsgD family transcriptional regulator
MFSNHYQELEKPSSVEKFTEAMQALCLAAGAERFIVFGLGGAEDGEVQHLLHSGSDAAGVVLLGSRHWTVDRLLTTLRVTGMPVELGAGGLEVSVEGFEFGAAAISRDAHSACAVVFGTDQPHATREALYELHAGAQMAAIYASCGLKVLMPPKTCMLRPRELECLAYYMAGKSTKETAEAMGIGPRTVEVHLDRARARYGVKATMVAGMRAVREGWITTAQIGAIRDAA